MARSKPAVKFDYAVICDEVRTEDNGKLILIGVYTGDILLSQFPATIALSAFLHGRATTLGECKIEVRCKIESEGAEANILRAEGVIKVTSTENEVSVPLGKLPISFAAPGLLKLDCRVDGGGWKNLVTKRALLSSARKKSDD